jgi:hypothetical protein
MAVFWTAEIKSENTEWRALSPFDYRNTVGLACSGARYIDPATEGYDTEDQSGPIPGVFRYTVVPGSIVAGVSVDLYMDVIKSGDLHHPYIDITTGGTYAINDWTNYPTGSDIMLYISSLVTESCQFEVGYGYEWSDAESDWMPITSFGVNFPGEYGRSAFLRLTNNTAYDQVNSKIIWSNDGSTDGLWRVRKLGGSWISDGSNELLFEADDCVSGHVPIGDSVTLEIQPIIPEGTTAVDNPIIGTFNVFSVSI